MSLDGFRGGSGEPLVLIHGITMSWRAWEPVVPLLTPTYDVYAPTLPGHRGGPPLNECTLTALVDGAERLLDAARIDRAHLVANSLGGMVGVQLARRGRALSLTDFAGPLGWAGQRAIDQVRRHFGLSLQVARTGIPGALCRYAGARRLIFRDAMKHGDRVSVVEARGALLDALACTQALELIRGVAAEGYLEPLDGAIPVTLVWPERDRTLSWEKFGRHTADRLPDTRLVRLATTGHVPTWDDRDAVVRLINQTVARALS
jgi:pimeloyl-ACP methyl ester carboxylesterase